MWNFTKSCQLCVLQWVITKVTYRHENKCSKPRDLNENVPPTTHLFFFLSTASISHTDLFPDRDL